MLRIFKRRPAVVQLTELSPRIVAVKSLTNLLESFHPPETKAGPVKQRHTRAAQLAGINILRARLPSAYIQTPAFYPDPWWVEEEVAKKSPSQPKQEGVEVLDKDSLGVTLLNGRRIVFHRLVKFDHSRKRRYKEFFSEDGEGKKISYNSIPRSLLPLFFVNDRGEKVEGFREETIEAVTVVEGTRPARSLGARGRMVAGTLTGAFVAPSVDALMPLMKAQKVYLWPDNDPVGVRHMDLVAQRLHEMQHSRVFVIRWLHGPRKGDAEDFPEDEQALAELYSQAKQWTPEHRVSQGGVLRLNVRPTPTKIQLEKSLEPPMLSGWI